MPEVIERVVAHIYHPFNDETGTQAGRVLQESLSPLFMTYPQHPEYTFELVMCPHSIERVCVHICGLWEFRKWTGFRGMLISIGYTIRWELGDEELEIFDGDCHRRRLFARSGEPLSLAK